MCLFLERQEPILELIVLNLSSFLDFLKVASTLVLVLKLRDTSSELLVLSLHLRDLLLEFNL